MTELLFKEEVYAIIGAAIEVYNELGPGFLEAVYQEALGIEFETRGVPHAPQKQLKLYYKQRQLRKEYIADYSCYERIIVELKAIERLGSSETAQLLNYLKATRYRLGLLINFGSAGKMEWKRLIN